MIMRLWPVLVVCMAVASAAAAEPPAGTKNFAPPSGVPNYFSNEAGAPLGSGGIVRPHAPRPTIVDEDEDQRPQRVVASARHRDTRHHVSARDKRRAAKLAAARSKHRATKLAADKARKAKLTAAKSAGANRTAAHTPAKAKPVEAAAQNRSAPAKPKQQPAHHAG